jgi:hypothetical protein
MKDSCLWALEKKGVTGSYGPTLAYTFTPVCWNGKWQVEVGPTWRTLVLWSAGTGSVKWGLAYLAYTCTLVCWNRFCQVGAGLPGVHLYSGLLEPVLASGGWPT